MSGDNIKRFVEVLNTTFSACDENETGFVEINRIIDFLIAEDPSWLENETIREEFHKILHRDLNYMISKEDFIKSLQGWFEAIQYQDVEKENEEHINEAEKCSSSTSGIGEPSDISSGSSTNSMEGVYSGRNLVSDEQIFTNEDLADAISLNDTGGSQAESRLVKVLQSEISTLLRKNEYLENMNDSLLGQVSCLEETLGKKKEESEDYKKQLIKTNERLEMQIQKHEETEDRINRFTEENKLFTTQLSQSGRENIKLKTMVSNLEKKLESSSSETIEKTAKLKEITDKFNNINELYNNCTELLEQERENFRFKEEERENAWREAIEDIRNLQSQLDANTFYTEDIKCKLRAALKELSEIKSAKIKNVMKTDPSSSSLLSADNSMVFLDGNISLDSTIPFETSLLAELKDEVQPDKECCCVCKQSVSLIARSSETADAAIGTITTETVEKATMTTLCKPGKCSLCSDVEYKDVGVECSLKNISHALGDRESSMFCLVKSRRSIRKWASLFGVLLILCFLLVFFSFSIFLSSNFRRSHKPMFHITFFLDLLHVHVKTLDIFFPIK